MSELTSSKSVTQGEPERGDDWVFLPEGPLPPEGEVVLCIDARGEYALDWISGHEKPEWGNDQPWETLCWRKPHAKPTQRPSAQPSPVVQTNCRYVPAMLSGCSSYMEVDGISHVCKLAFECPGKPHECYCGEMWQDIAPLAPVVPVGETKRYPANYSPEAKAMSLGIEVPEDIAHLYEVNRIRKDDFNKWRKDPDAYNAAHERLTQ